MCTNENGNVLGCEHVIHTALELDCSPEPCSLLFSPAVAVLTTRTPCYTNMIVSFLICSVSYYG